MSRAYKSPNQKTWEMYGVLPKGMEHADKLTELILKFYEESKFKYSPDFLRLVELEVTHQLVGLPQRTKAYQKKTKFKK